MIISVLVGCSSTAPENEGAFQEVDSIPRKIIPVDTIERCMHYLPSNLANRLIDDQITYDSMQVWDNRLEPCADHILQPVDFDKHSLATIQINYAPLWDKIEQYVEVDLLNKSYTMVNVLYEDTVDAYDPAMYLRSLVVVIDKADSTYAIKTRRDTIPW